MNAQFTKTNLPAVLDGPVETPHQAQPKASRPFDAHVLGQDNRRRGLKGGQPVLDAARAAYLDAEWRGADDRRLTAGTFRKVVL